MDKGNITKEKFFLTPTTHTKGEHYEKMVTDTFFDCITNCSYVPDTVMLVAFNRIFNTPCVSNVRYLHSDDGAFSIDEGVFSIDMNSSTKGFTRLEASFFKTLSERSIAFFAYDSMAFVGFFEETMITFYFPNDDCFYVRSIFSNLTDEELLKIFDGAKKYSSKKKNFQIALASKECIYTTEMKDIKEMDVDLEKNYCEDLPYDRMKNILSKDEKGLVLLYGEPGTGKSTLIRKLMFDCSPQFIMMDPGIITSISDSEFIVFLSNNANSVIVLEDCEKLLVSREESANKTIGTILNLTDGIIGDAFKIKFICTFNSDIKNVDKALLRKGRLSLKYEFKKLPVEKAKLIYPDANEEMTLADAYFASDENDYSKVEKKKIGW